MNELLKALVVSGSLGALVGLERQWDEQNRDPEARIPAGVRTFTLIALFGTLCAHFSANLHPLVFAAGLLALAIWLGSHFLAGQDGTRVAGLTTAASAAVVYLVGGLAYSGEWKEAVVISFTLLILLAGKTPIHRLSQRFTKEDVRTALQFLAVSGVVLPLVPDRDFGPFDAFNPRSVWMMVVMVSGLGFVGYIAVRALGQSLGIVLTGLAGGLASSTATTLSMSKLSKSQPGLSEDCALAVVLACTVMLWRVGVLVLLISPELALQILPDLAIMSVSGIVFAIRRMMKRSSHNGNEGEYKNPLSLKVALQFAVLYALVVFVVKAAQAWFGKAGVMIASFLSGLTDLDAIALSLSKMFSEESMTSNFAIACIVLAAVANSGMKLALAWSFGSRQLAGRVILLLGLTALLGTGLILVRLLVF